MSIQDYEKGALLGRGQYSEVYSGVHIATGQPVALKVRTYNGECSAVHDV